MAERLVIGARSGEKSGALCGFISRAMKLPFDVSPVFGPHNGCKCSITCGPDEGVRQKVEALIAAHEQSGEFLDAPAFELAGSTLKLGRDQRSGFHSIHGRDEDPLGGLPTRIWMRGSRRQRQTI